MEVVFRPLIKVEGLTSKEFRQSKVSITDHTAVIFTAKTAIDHYFRLCQELRFKVPDTMKYFCVSEKVANYLQKYVQYRKRKIFVSPTGKAPELIPFMVKHSKEKYLFPMSDVHDSNNSVIEQCGIPYTKAVMYRTVSNKFEKGEKFDYDMIILFTPSGVHSLKQSFPRFKQGDLLIGAMGPKTIEALKEAGLRLDVTTSEQVPSMVTAIDKFLEAEARREEREAKKLAAEQAGGAAKKVPGKKTVGASKPAVKAVAKKTTTAKPIAKKSAKPAVKNAIAEAKRRAAEEAARKEAELFARRSAAAKKGAATRAAKKAAAEEDARKKAELFARRSAAAKKGAVTRAAKKAAEEEAKRRAAEEAARKEAELFARRSAAAKKAAATRAAKKAAAEKAAKARSEAAKKAAATRAAKKAAAEKTGKSASKKATATKKK